MVEDFSFVEKPVDTKMKSGYYQIESGYDNREYKESEYDGDDDDSLP